MTTTKIVEHKHCRICTKAIPSDQNFCSDKCKEEMTRLLRRRRLMVYMLYGLIAIFIAAMLISSRVGS